MANCPSAVEGAKTEIKDVDGGVELTITGSGDAVKDIQGRAKAIAEAAKSEASTRKHSGTGEGGGAFGRCPVVLRDTDATLGPYLDARGQPLSKLPLARRLPPATARNAYTAEARSPAGLDLLPKGFKSG